MFYISIVMPKSKNAKRKRKVGTTNIKIKRKADYSGISTITVGCIGFPDRANVKLRLSDTFAIGTVSLMSQSYRLSSINKPKVGGSDRPMGYNEWTSFYDRYQVKKVTYNITYISNALASADVFVQITDANVPDTLPLALRARRFVQRAYITSANGGRPIVTIKGSVNPATIYGLHELHARNRDYTALVNADPLSNWFLIAYIKSTDDTATVEVIAKVELTFHVTLYDRKQLSISVVP